MHRPSEVSQQLSCFSSYICSLKINLGLQSQGDKGRRMAIITQQLHNPSRVSQAQAWTWCLTWIAVASLHSPSSSASLGSLWPLGQLMLLLHQTPKNNIIGQVSEVEVEELHFKCAKIIKAREFFSSSQLYKAVTAGVAHCTTRKERVIQTTVWECKMKNMTSCR